MNIQRIHHVAYRCLDAKQTVLWYQQHLGMDFVLAIAEDQVPSTHAPDPYMHVFLDAGGGCAVFDREKFLALGGFDELYWPFYGEDTDLSYGAWKRGFRVLVEPRSIMYHRHAATIQHNPQTRAVCQHNIHLFFWKNITDPLLIVKHLAWLAILIPVRTLRGQTPYLRGVWTALRKLPQALKRRREMKPLWTRTDAEVWALARDNGAQPLSPKPRA